MVLHISQVDQGIGEVCDYAGVQHIVKDIVDYHRLDTISNE
jgi:hypothetical protein